MKNLQLTAIIERDDDGYVALCPQIDVASQGKTADEARANLKEAVELFFESASEAEVQQRFTHDLRVETLEVNVA